MDRVGSRVVDDEVEKVGRRSQWASLMRLSVLVAAMLTQMGCASNRLPDGPPLQLHRGKFTYNSAAKQPIFDWFALDPAFAAVLERHTAALEEANKAPLFHTAALGAGAIGTAFVIKGTLASIDDDPFAGDELLSQDDILFFAFALGAYAFDRVARGYIKRSASLFNAEERNASGRQAVASSRLGSLFHNFDLSPSYAPGYGAGLVVRSRIPLR